MSKVSTIVASLAVLPVLAFVAPVFADSPGDLAGGTDIYQVRNVTKSGGYVNNLTVSCDEVVKYSAKLSNTDFGKITNITVKAPLSGQMTASGTNSAGATTSTSGSVTVTASTGTLAYVSGSTKLVASDGSVIKDLSDTVTTSGVNVGDLSGSTVEFVQFQAKVQCETPPTPKQIQVCELSTKKIVTINESEYNTAKYTTDLSKCKEVPTTPETPQTPTTPTTPTELPHTGAGGALAIVAGATAFAGLAHRAFTFRRQSR